MERGNCRSCNAPVLWVLSQASKRMILDAEPVSDGNTVVRDGIGVVLKKGEIPQPGEQLFKSHYATCPDAQAWRHKTRTRQ